MQTTTIFNPEDRYIIIPFFVFMRDGRRRQFKAILDTGAPKTEFSDKALQYAGFDIKPREDVKLHQGLQTQKYANIILPVTEICSHRIQNLDVYVSHFEKSWGIDALIGLDFFRRFEVKVNYTHGQITTNPL
jgi:predicted aspartyl protease